MSLETDRIEADLNESRHRLNDTIDALGHKLSPGQMLDEAIGVVQGQAGQFASKLGSQVRDNPVPTLLIAVGIAWLIAGNRSGSGPSASERRRYRTLEEARWATPRLAGETDEAYDDRVHLACADEHGLKQKAGEAMHDFKSRVMRAAGGAKRMAGGARDKVASAWSNASHAVQDQAHRLGDRAVQAGHRAEDFYQHTPMAAGAMALAAGALIGSFTPLTQTERRSLRGVADRAVRTGADLAERGARAVEQRFGSTSSESSDGSIH